MRIVDQHAAHERVRLEQLKNRKTTDTPVSQPLLTPQVFSLSQSEKQNLLSHTADLQSIGFEIQDFGGNEIALHALPAHSAHIDVEKLFHALLDDADDFSTDFSSSLKGFKERAMSYTACRGAKKFGDVMTLIDMEALITDWKNCAHPESCAHGRPVSIFYPYKDLENECGRY